MLASPPSLALLSASVTICASACLTAASISSSEYLPEPSIKRDVNSYFPNLNVSFNCSLLSVPVIFAVLLLIVLSSFIFIIMMFGTLN